MDNVATGALGEGEDFLPPPRSVRLADPNERSAGRNDDDTRLTKKAEEGKGLRTTAPVSWCASLDSCVLALLLDRARLAHAMATTEASAGNANRVLRPLRSGREKPSERDEGAVGALCESVADGPSRLRIGQRP